MKTAKEAIIEYIERLHKNGLINLVQCEIAISNLDVSVEECCYDDDEYESEVL